MKLTNLLGILLLPAAVNAQVTLTASPTALVFSHANGVPPAAQFVDLTLTPSGKPLDLVVFPVTDSFNWLRTESPSGSISSTARVRVSVDPTSLPNGTYQGIVRATAVQGTSSLTVSVAVTFTVTGVVGGGGSSKPTVLFSPTQLTFQSAAGVSPPDQILQISTSVNSRLPFAIASNAPWLAVLNNAGTTPAQIPVRAVTNGLAPGTYSALLTLAATDIANPGATVPVTLQVDSPGQSATVAPPQLTLTSLEGAPPPSGQSLAVNGPPGARYDVSVSESWLTVSTASGVTPGSFTVFLKEYNFTAGTFTAFIRINFANSSLTVPVTWVIGRNPKQLRFTGRDFVMSWQRGTPPPRPALCAFTPLDGTPVAYTATTTTPWLSISSNAGTSPAPFTIGLLPFAGLMLPVGTHQGSVLLRTPGATPELSVINVVLRVSDSPLPLVNTATVKLAAMAGSANQVVVHRQIRAAQGQLPLGVQVLNSSPTNVWWQVALSSYTTPSTLSVVATPGSLLPGTYSLTVRITSGANSVDIPVEFTSSATPRMSLFLGDLDFAPDTQFEPRTLQVSSTTSTNFPYTITPFVPNDSGRWLSFSAVGGFTLGQHTVAVIPSLANPGTHYAWLILLAPGASDPILELPVTLTVASDTLLRAIPLSLSFTQAAGEAPPPAKTLQIESGRPAPFRITTTVLSPANNLWLNVSPGQGTTNATLAVGPGPSAATLPPGNYAATLTLSGPESSNAEAIEVKLTVTEAIPPPPGTPVVSAVAHAATYRRDVVSPGMLVTLAGENLGPVPAVSGEVQGGRFANSAGGRFVYFDGIAVPVLYAGPTQINAIVPYALAGRVSARVWVQAGSLTSAPRTVSIVPSAPGIFTVDGSQAAALNEDGSLNSPAHPSSGGRVVTLFVTGEGLVTPEADDGEVILPSRLRRPIAPVRVQVAGVEIPAADILYAGSAPGLVSGLMQLNFRLPARLPAQSALPIEVTVGGSRSPATATIAVR